MQVNKDKKMSKKNTRDFIMVRPKTTNPTSSPQGLIVEISTFTLLLQHDHDPIQGIL